MQRISLSCLILASACSVDGTGTVVYRENGTGHLRAVDVASGQDTLIDGSGSFGEIAIAPDGRHAAYEGADNVVRVTDFAGHITPLPFPTRESPLEGCAPGPTWAPNNSLTYCINEHGLGRIGFVSAPGVAVRELVADDLAVSEDASVIVYHTRPDDPNQLGDVVVENADGSGQRVLHPSIIDRGLTFMPDGAHVVAEAENPVAFRVVILGLADATVTDLGPGQLPVAPAGGSIFSPDRSELLTVLGSELVAVQPTTGVRRHFADVGPGVTIDRASFIDADHVIYQRREDTQIPGSDVFESAQSIRVASVSDEVIAAPESGQCDLHLIAVDAGFAAIECNAPAIVAFDGELRASSQARFALGISADRSGIVTYADDGTVALLQTDGQSRTLATAMPRNDPSPILGPFAAYAP